MGLSRKEQLEFCKKCINRKFIPEKGLVCSKTGEWADFEGECQSFVLDDVLLIREAEYEEERKIRRMNNWDPFGIRKRGIRSELLYGIVLLLIGSVWLYFGMKIGLLFFYPVALIIFGGILFIIGFVRLVWKMNNKKKSQNREEILDR